MDFREMDQYWVNYWKTKRTFKMNNDNLLIKSIMINPTLSNENAYLLILNDIYARFLRKRGFNVQNSYLVDHNSNEELLDKLGLSYDINQNYYIDDEQISIFKKEVIDLIKKSKYYKKITDEIDFTDFYKEIENKDFFQIKEGITIYYPIVDFLGTVTTFEINYHLIFGASFLTIYYKDQLVKEILSYDELDAYNEFLNSSDEFEIFSGRYAKLPLVNKNIPIFITKRFEDNHLGIPSLNEIDKEISSSFGLEIINPMENGILISSDILNGLSIEEAKEEVARTLISINSATYIKKYPLEKMKLKDLYLEKYLMQFLPILYRDEYFLSNEEREQEILKYKEINFLSLYEEESKDYIIYQFISKILLNLEFTNKILLFPKKSLNYDISIDNYRLSIILKHTNIEDTEKFLNIIWKIGFYVENDNSSLDLLFDRMMKKGIYYYEKFDFENLLNIVNLFLNEALKIKKISSRQMLGLLKLLNPIVPIITEELYKTLFNGYGTIAFEDL